MARLLRIQFEDAYYHVTCCGNSGQEILSNDADRAAFLDLLERSGDIYQTEILAYLAQAALSFFNSFSNSGCWSSNRKRFTTAATGLTSPLS